MKTDEMWEAHYHAQAAANDLLVAYTIKGERGRDSNIYTESALKHAEKFAAHLGFELVKREPAKEPAEEAA
jgi:hypothetical protein